MKNTKKWIVCFYSSGANPYIIKTTKEEKKLLKKYGDKMEWNIYEECYFIDDYRPKAKYYSECDDLPF